MILGKQKKLSLSTKGEISFKNNEKNNSSLETSVNYKIKGKKLNSSIKCTIVLSLWIKKELNKTEFSYIFDEIYC